MERQSGYATLLHTLEAALLVLALSKQLESTNTDFEAARIVGGHVTTEKISGYLKPS